ncbi:MAG TPA: HlyD family secretion protein [Leptolyngbyaceae cyanobacterium]
MERSTISLNRRGSVVVEKELITDSALVENELVVDTDTTEEINHQKTFVLTPEHKEAPVEEPDGDTEQLFEQPKNKQKRKLPKALILAGLGAIAIVSGITGYHWWQYASVHESTEDAYIRGNVHPVSSRINGTVASVLVDDNQQVKEGQLLVKLDPSDYQVQSQQSQAALEAAQRQANAAQSNINYASKNAQGNITQAQGNISNAQAAVATAQAAVKEAQAGIPAAGAQVAQANANLQNLEVDYKRYQNLYQSGAIARQQLDSARTAYQVAVAEKNTAMQSVAQAEAKLAQAQQSVAEAQAKFAASKGGLVQAQAGNAQTEVNRSQYQAAKAAIAQAQAQLNNSKLQLSYTNIVAPSTGHVGNKSVEVGQRVQPGTPLMAIVDNNNWVVANFKETQLAKMHPGQPVEVDIDAIPNHHFTGHVQSFSPGSGATFALLPPDNATGNFTKIVQRIPVKIVLDPQSVKGYESRITPGMSVVATVDVSK